MESHAIGTHTMENDSHSEENRESDWRTLMTGGESCPLVIVDDYDDSGSGGLVFSAGFGKKRRGAVGPDVISQRAHRRRLTSAVPRDTCPRQECR